MANETDVSVPAVPASTGRGWILLLVAIVRTEGLGVPPDSEGVLPDSEPNTTQRLTRPNPLLSSPEGT